MRVRVSNLFRDSRFGFQRIVTALPALQIADFLLLILHKLLLAPPDVFDAPFLLQALESGIDRVALGRGLERFREGGNDAQKEDNGDDNGKDDGDRVFETFHKNIIK